MNIHQNKIVPGLLFASGIFLVGGTAAYQTAFAHKANTVAVGQNTTVIEEEFPDPAPTPVTENPDYRKKVWISNHTSAEEGFNVDCYVRAMITYSNYDIGRAVVLKNVNTSDWEYRNDGYYYYKKLLKQGEKTNPLFSGFSIQSSEVEDSYQPYIQDFSISIYEESVEGGDFADFHEAWDYYLNPVS